MRIAGTFLVVLALAAWPVSAAADSARVSARIGAGAPATATATEVAGDRVLLEIALPDGRTQSFPGLGETLVPISGKPGEPGLIARDLDRDGKDEIVIRGSVPPRGALLVFRWSDANNEYEPVDFIDDRDRSTKFLVVDASLPVLLDGAGSIEAQYQSVRADGRKSYHVARYRWSGKDFRHSPDN